MEWRDDIVYPENVRASTLVSLMFIMAKFLCLWRRNSRSVHAAGTQFLLLVSAGKSCLSAMCGRGCKEEAEEALHQLVILFKIINYPSIIFVFSSVKFRGRSRREGWKVMEDSSAVFENKKNFCSCSTANLVVVLFGFFWGGTMFCTSNQFLHGRQGGILVNIHKWYCLERFSP